MTLKGLGLTTNPAPDGGTSSGGGNPTMGKGRSGPGGRPVDGGQEPVGNAPAMQRMDITSQSGFDARGTSGPPRDIPRGGGVR